jgi:hypothetical protein
MPVPSGRRLLAVLVTTALSTAVLGMAGCETLDEAGPGIDRADLVNDLATRLDRSTELTYSADYQLPGGASAAIVQAQQPPRAAYSYPGGKLTVTADAITECLAGATPNGITPASGVKTPRSTCTISAPPTPTDKPAPATFTAARERGLIAPAVVISLLTAAALDAEAVVKQHDTTIAGRHATCVEVSNVKNAAASAFSTCVTTEGVLGSFTGSVNGSTVDIAMTRIRDAADPDAFKLPAAAKVVDNRPGG